MLAGLSNAPIMKRHSRLESFASYPIPSMIQPYPLHFNRGLFRKVSVLCSARTGNQASCFAG